MLLSWFNFIFKFSSSEQRDAVHEDCQSKLKNQEVLHSKEIQKQQQYVEKLQQQILDGQIKAEQELEHDQAIINQWIKESEFSFPLSLSILIFFLLTLLMHNFLILLWFLSFIHYFIILKVRLALKQQFIFYIHWLDESSLRYFKIHSCPS